MLTRRQLLTNVAKAAGFGAAATLFPSAVRRAEAEDAAMPPQFKYAVCNELFGDWPFEKAFAFAAKCGYTGIEIAPFTLANYATDISAARRAEVRQQAKQAGLEVVGLHWLLAKTEGFHLTSPDAAVRRKTAAVPGRAGPALRRSGRPDHGPRLAAAAKPRPRHEQGARHEVRRRSSCKPLRRRWRRPAW